ncbi:MAG: hypothetical protein ACRDPM_14750 [Solirubrobacteraceae bacterium]
MRRRTIRLLVGLSLLLGVVFAAPSPGHVRHDLCTIDPSWVAAAVGLEGGLAGTLVLYGAPPATTAAAVLVYHAVAFWIPSLGGLGAYAALLSHPRSDRSDDASVSSTPLDPARRSRHRLGCPVRPAGALRAATGAAPHSGAAAER